MTDIAIAPKGAKPAAKLGSVHIPLAEFMDYIGAQIEREHEIGASFGRGCHPVRFREYDWPKARNASRFDVRLVVTIYSDDSYQIAVACSVPGVHKQLDALRRMARENFA